MLGIAEEQLVGLRCYQRASEGNRKLRYDLGSLSTASCAEKGNVINSCCSCIVLMTFC